MPLDVGDVAVDVAHLARELDLALTAVEDGHLVTVRDEHADGVRPGEGLSPEEQDPASRYSAYSSAMARTSSRIAAPSSTSSRVIVSGGTTMITFQCVIR